MTDFDPNCPYGHQTKDGRGAKIINTGYVFDSGETIVALIDEGGSAPILYTYFSDGRRFDNDKASNYDLINAPAPKRTISCWLNVYTDEEDCEWFSVHSSPAAAQSVRNEYFDTCIHIEHDIPEGTGLDKQPEPEEPKTVHLDVWANAYEDPLDFTFHVSKEAADATANSIVKTQKRIACTHIERDVKVGEGLDD